VGQLESFGSWGDEANDGPGALLELLEQRPAWWADAACRTAPANITWFPAQGEDVMAAKAICANCPAASDCLAWALDQGPELRGTWAGTSPKDRRRLRIRSHAAA
jgi:WhiB family redox-sensing transcriptional regulator